MRTRRTTSLVNNILNGNNARTKTGSHLSSTSRRKTSREKELAKEAHAKQLVVRCSETVDGGFWPHLAVILLKSWTMMLLSLKI